MNNQAKSKYLASFSVRNNLGQNSIVVRFFFNLAAFCMVIGLFMLMIWGANEISEPLSQIANNPISLDPQNLISYSLQTLFRMMIAAIISLLFALIYATIAAKNKYAEQIMIPLLDVLQSVPILGYMSFTVAGFLSLFPGNILGAELAAVFAIFTSQVWNMIFSLYQSFKTVPKELIEVSNILKLSAWQKFWKVELPFAIPGLVWNTAVSVSSGWFFVVASESITVGNYSLNLPGIGSYIALAMKQENWVAILYAIGSMIIVILLYDKLIMKPIIVWSDKFRYDMTSASVRPRSLVLNIFQRSILAQKISKVFTYISDFIVNIPVFKYHNPSFDNTKNIKKNIKGSNHNSTLEYIWYGCVLGVIVFSGYHLINFLDRDLGWSELIKVFTLAVITMMRVFAAILIASIIWIPIGVYIGLNPKLTGRVQPLVQFLASFPANLLFPVAVILITAYRLNPDIWLTLLMVMGTQWYILFNVIAGASSMPNEFKETAQVFGIKGWLWWRKIMIPSIIPYFLTGVITASGGAWNASIVAEVVSFGETTLIANGLGSYIAEMTTKADFQRIMLGISMMCLFVVVINKVFWQSLHDYTSKKFQL